MARSPRQTGTSRPATERVPDSPRSRFVGQALRTCMGSYKTLPAVRSTYETLTPDPKDHDGQPPAVQPPDVASRQVRIILPRMIRVRSFLSWHYNVYPVTSRDPPGRGGDGGRPVGDTSTHTTIPPTTTMHTTTTRAETDSLPTMTTATITPGTGVMRAGSGVVPRRGTTTTPEEEERLRRCPPPGRHEPRERGNRRTEPPLGGTPLPSREPPAFFFSSVRYHYTTTTVTEEGGRDENGTAVVPLAFGEERAGVAA